MRFLLWIIFFLFYLLSPSFFSEKVLAVENSQFITVVNPVRISYYNPDPVASLVSQYQQIKLNGLAASWLLTYDVISNLKLVEIAKNMDRSQELGIFMEVTPQYAQDAGVLYNKTDSWHRANSVFLSGYEQKDRIKLIDAVFLKFKQNFGFFPTSVGAWWIDAYSLNYMKQKYGVTANLGVTDQLATDGYSVWGQYWSVPFYPSKINASQPAGSVDNKIGVVTLQWAARDPLNGYFGAGRNASLYSTQDYFTIGLDDGYFKKLIDLYTTKNNNSFGQITLGLEGDFTPDAYEGLFAKQMGIIGALQKEARVSVGTMKDFSQWYIKNFPDLSPVHSIVTEDLLGSRNKVIWYQSPHYRVGIKYDLQNKITEVFDLRIYNSNLLEPYFLLPNKQLNLIVNVPSVLDFVSSNGKKWVISKSEATSFENNSGEVVFHYQDGRIIKFGQDGIFSSQDWLEQPQGIFKHIGVSASKKDNNHLLIFKDNPLYGKDGYRFFGLTPSFSNFIKTKKVKIIYSVGFVMVIIFLFLITRSRLKDKFKMVSIFSTLVLLSGGIWFYISRNGQYYFVSQGELDGLYYLSLLDAGKVMVADKNCLNCSYHSDVMPAVFANKREYVKKFSKKSIVYNRSVFESTNRALAKQDFDKLGVKYIYLTTFEDYQEKLPFSPGDLGIERVYQNAYAEVWKVK